MFLQYDAIVKGQASRAEELASDFNDIRHHSVAIEKHTRDLNLLEQRLSDQLSMQENKVESTGEMVRQLAAKLKALKEEQKEILENPVF